MTQFTLNMDEYDQCSELVDYTRSYLQTDKNKHTNMYMLQQLTLLCEYDRN